MSGSPVRVVDAASRAPTPQHLIARGIDELRLGIANWRVWHLMGSADVRRRYARSRLGQIWIILSTAVTFSCMAVVWSLLWQVPLAQMLPYVAASYVVWLFISNTIGESANAFPDHRGYFANQNMPIANIMFAGLYRNLIIFGFNIVLPIAIALGFGVSVGWQVILIVPGLVLASLACLALSFLVGILCARFRDFGQLTAAILQIAFYLSPVLWKPEQLPAQVKGLVSFNPFAILIGVIRDPLLGRPVPLSSWVTAIAIVAVLWAVALLVIGHFRRRVVFWL